MVGIYLLNLMEYAASLRIVPFAAQNHASDALSRGNAQTQPTELTPEVRAWVSAVRGQYLQRIFIIRV